MRAVITINAARSIDGNRPMDNEAFSNREIEEIVVLTRLSLYNHGKACGQKAIRQAMDGDDIRPLPSLSRIARILSRHGLTHRSTGIYP